MTRLREGNAGETGISKRPIEQVACRILTRDGGREPLGGMQAPSLGMVPSTTKAFLVGCVWTHPGRNSRAIRSKHSRPRRFAGPDRSWRQVMVGSPPTPRGKTAVMPNRHATKLLHAAAPGRVRRTGFPIAYPRRAERRQSRLLHHTWLAADGRQGPIAFLALGSLRSTRCRRIVTFFPQGPWSSSPVA